MIVRDRFSFYVAWVALFLVFLVVMLGVLTRLKDAGLGCPDWPGCYGQITVPIGSVQLQHAKVLFPHQAVDQSKAWFEMIHRYAALTLGGLLIIIGVRAIWRCYRDKQPIILPLLILAIVILQAMLGKWTVTMKLLPWVVMSHLLGGMILFSLLCLLVVELGGFFHNSELGVNKKIRPWAIVGLVVVFLQIALGGWTSAHYAALICPDFPFCHGEIPTLYFRHAFDLWEYTSSETTRMTIQFMHRLGGLITLLYVSFFSLWLIIAGFAAPLRRLGTGLLFLILLQVCLGILNVLWVLPLPIAIAHNSVAVLILASMVILNYYLYAKH